MANTLKEILETYQNLERAEKHLKHVIMQIEVEEKNLARWGRILEEAKQDVKRLEKLSVKALFHEFLGDKKKQLEIEKQEYLDTVLKYNESVKLIELLEFERDVLKDKLTQKEAVKKSLEAVLKIREKEILKSNSAKGKELLIIEKQIDQKLALKREVHEAFTIGAKIVHKLTLMINVLGETQYWGATVGFHVESKRSRGKLDKTLDIAFEVRQLLIEFEDELVDVYSRKKFKFKTPINSIINFTINLRSNLITDWLIQERINNTFHHVVAFKDQIKRLNDSLRLELTNADKGIEYLNEKKKQTLMEL